MKLKSVIPVLHVSQSVVADVFYRQKLGFKLEFSNIAVTGAPDPCYSGYSRDGIWLHLSSFPGDGISGAVVNISVDDVDSLHAEFSAKAVRIDLKPTDQTWGTREMYVRDPDRNCLRFIQSGRNEEK